MGLDSVPVRRNPVLSSLSLTGNGEIVPFNRLFSFIVLSIQLKLRKYLSKIIVNIVILAYNQVSPIFQKIQYLIKTFPNNI